MSPGCLATVVMAIATTAAGAAASAGSASLAAPGALAAATALAVPAAASAGAAPAPASAPAAPPPSTDVSSTPAGGAAAQKAALHAVKAMVGAIRYGRDERAQGYIDFAGMGAMLLGDVWTALSEPERKEAAALIGKLVRGSAFTAGREAFGQLDGIIYGKPSWHGDRVHVPVTVVVHHGVKKGERVIEWVLSGDNDRWQVVDTIVLGESTAAAIYEEQVRPLAEHGGAQAVLAALRERASKLP